MSENEKLYKNLLMILKMFKNRPYHLAKYLVDNNAFDQKFIDKIINSEKLKDLNEKETNNFFPDQAVPVYFINVSQMNDYYNSLFDDTTDKKKSRDELTNDLNKKLDRLLKEEKYEEAARLRDYMLRNDIKIILKNI
jgi:hypothetical protein